MTDLAQMTTTEMIEEMDRVGALIDAQDEGRDLLVLAFGETFYLEETMGEIMASVDRKRIGTPSMYVSRIVEALRFLRAQPELLLLVMRTITQLSLFASPQPKDALP